MRGEEGRVLVDVGVEALMEAMVRIRRKILPNFGSPSCETKRTKISAEEEEG